MNRSQIRALAIQRSVAGEPKSSIVHLLHGSPEQRDAAPDDYYAFGISTSVDHPPRGATESYTTLYALIFGPDCFDPVSRLIRTEYEWLNFGLTMADLVIVHVDKRGRVWGRDGLEIR